MQKIDTLLITSWRIASKTKPIKAKPLINLLVDKNVTNKFLIDTLEGREPLGDGVVICVGEAGDTWQQMPNKLLKKYTVEAIDNDGWMVCQPKPDNEVDFYEIESHDLNHDNDFYIIGLWGETIDNETNVQRGVVGDVICRNRQEHSDVWIVHRKLFLNTYIIKS